ncbi:hypothetical protein JTE90_006082 [Oedothorax gibbosus]|uniref:SHSP domain-containing protein n=1 Tax=Oedothorax gibbosus TaxID=931172 RepID=A0AAV6V6N0_9ARAC|nr:hypothetical protein JTE90_006082 [Oedothorax gibbosus]
MSFSSLVPVFMGRDWWDSWDYPARIMDQCFASPLLDSDLLAPQLYRGFVLRPRTQSNVAASGQSEVKNDDQQFQVSLNVSQFKPDEIQVKVVDNYVEIHAKHEEKSDDHGFVSREFTRRYVLPRSCQGDLVTSSLTPEGVLTIEAPKKALEDVQKNERPVPIEQKPKEN